MSSHSRAINAEEPDFSLRWRYWGAIILFNFMAQFLDTISNIRTSYTCVQNEELVSLIKIFFSKGGNTSWRLQSSMYLIEMTAKIVKKTGDKPTDFESSIAQALLELEANTDLKQQLKELHITAAKEVDAGDKKAIVVFVPVPQMKAYQKIQTRLVRELEKKFSGRQVVFIAQRRILPKPTRMMNNKSKQKRPMSRTLTHVHEMILEDLVFPAEIVGKRVRIKLDGSRLIKVHLDKAQQTNIEHKTDTFGAVYKKLTGKDVTFEFPESYM